MLQPCFVLCPLRSYSSVVCAILGQHPEAYGLPELNLFLADDLGSVWQRLSVIMPHGHDGLLRVLAELHDGEQSEAAVDRAKAWVEQQASWPARRVLQHIQDLVGTKMLVEKSPATVMRRQHLERMYAAFPEANLLHLTRHPRSTCRSMLSLSERSAAWGGRFAELEFDPERAWLRAHQNILDFTADLPAGQCMMIKGEDLLANLDLYLPQIAEWLGISTKPAAIRAMLRPERSPYARIGPENAGYGNDLDFLENPALDPGRLTSIDEPTLEGELEWQPGTRFSKEVMKLAKQFGYR